MQGNWNYPTPIRFGAGRVKEAGDACLELGMKKPLIVTDADLAELINLGLSLGDVERLWGGVEGVSAEAIHTAGQRLLTAGNTGMVPLGRQTSLGLDLVSRRGAEATELDVSPVLVALKAEVDDPPDRFRDPIMLTIMSDPVVLSSGHVFDRSTVYESPTGGGPPRFRFQSCPMSRARIDAKCTGISWLARRYVNRASPLLFCQGQQGDGQTFQTCTLASERNEPSAPGAAGNDTFNADFVVLGKP